MKLIPRWVEEHFSGILSERSKRSSLTSGNNAIRIQERILVLPQQHPHRNSTPAAVTHHEVQQLSSSHNSSKNEMMSTSVIQSSSCSSKSGNESRDRDSRRTSRQLQFLQLHHERLQQNRHFLLRHHEHEQVQPNHEVQANITREEQETLNENPVFQQNNRRISSSVYDRRPTETTDIVSSKHHLVRRPTPTKRTPTKNVLRGRHAVQQNHHREKRHALFLDNGKQDDSDEELMDDLCDQRKHSYFTQRQPSHRHHLRSHDNNHLRRPVINQRRPLLLEESYNQPCNRHSPLSTPVIRASSSTPSSMMNRVTNNQWTQRSSVNSSILHLQEKHRQEPSSSSSRRVSSSSNRNYILKENDDSEDDDYDDPYCPSNVAAASTIEMMMTSKENAAFEKEEYLTVFMSNNHNRNASRSKTATAAVKTTQTSSKKKKQNSSFIASSSSSSTSHSPSTRIESRVTKGNSRTRDSINSSNSNRRNSKTAAAKNTAVDQQRSSAQSVVKMMLSQTHRNDSGSSCSTSPASSVSSSAGKARERSGIKTNPWLESPWMPQSSQSIVDDTSSSIDSPSSSTADSGCSLLSIQNRCNTSDINNRTASSSVVNNSLTITRRKITPSKNSAFDVVNNNKEVNDNDNIYSRRSTASSSSCMTTSTLHDNTSNRSSTHSNILRLPSINYNELLNDLTNFTNLNDSMNLSDKLLQLCISRENNSTEEIMTPLEMKSSSSGISSVDQNAMLSPGDDANFISNRNSSIFSSDESNRNSFVDSDDAVMTALMASQESMMTSSSSSNSLVLLPPPPDQDYSRTILANFLHNMISTNNDSKTTVTEKKTGKEETSVRYNGPLNGSDSTSYSFLRRETAGQRMTNDSVMKMKEETDNGNNHYNRNHGLHSPSNDRQGVDDDMLDDTNGNRLERQEVTASLVKEDLDKDLRCNDRLEDVFGHQPILLRRKQTSKYSGLDNRKQAHLTSECIAGRNEIKVDNDDNHHLLDGVPSTPQEPATAEILLHSPKLLSFSRNEGQERKSSSPQKETSRLSFPCSSSETTMKSVARKEALFPELPASSLRRQPENEDIKETLERTQENGKKLDDSLGLLGDKTVKEDKHETEDILASFSSLTRSFDEQFYAGCKRQGEENSNDKTSQASSSRHSFASDRPSSLSSCQSYSSDFKNFLQIKKDASSAGSSLMSVMTGSSSSGLESATSSFTDSSVSAGRRYYSSLWNKRRFTPSVSTLREVGNPSVRRRIRNEEWVSTATEELVDQLFE